MPRTPLCRLRAEALEDRTTPAVAVALSGASLLVFDTVTPTAATTTAITNVAAGETLVGIDFRPQNGHLYGLGVNATGTGTLYDISTRTGRATPVGPTGGVTTTDGLPNPATAGTGFAFDFNPLTDLIRVVATDGDNFAIDPDTGTTAANETVAGTALGLSGAAYTNDAPNVTATTFYVIGAAADALYIVPNPASGAATLVGALGVGDFTAVNGFDIPAGVNAATSGTPVATGSGFAALAVGGVSRLYAVNLVTGAGTLIGTIGGGAAVGGLAVQSDYGGLPALALGGAAPGAANLVRFNTATPGTTTPVAVTGLGASDTLVGLDLRPSTGQLYALGVNAGTGNGTLYRIAPQTGAATAVGAVGSVNLATDLPNPAAGGYGFDFDPTADVIRVVTAAGQNFAVSPATGAVLAADPTIRGDAISADAAAYTNGFGQPPAAGNPTTTLYVLDAFTDTLYVQDTASGFTAAVAPVKEGGASLDLGLVNGFDIPAGVVVGSTGEAAAGFGYATLVVGGTPRLYRIDLTTGAATSVGATGATLSGLALGDAPGGVVRFQGATAAVGEAAGVAGVVLTRTAATGPLTVTVSVTGGTAAAGADFVAGPYAVTFPEGATTATLTIPVTADVAFEGDETVVFALSAPGAAVGAQTTTTLTIVDDDPAPAPPPPPATPGRPLVVGGAGGQALRFTPAAGGQYGATPSATLTPFAGFAGAVRTAAGDVDGDGTPDAVLVTGPGTPLRVAVVSGADNGTLLVAPFDPFGGDFPGGGYVAAADLDGDNRAEFVVTPDQGGGPRVTVFSRNPDGTTAVRANFLGIDDPNFRGGARAAVGDVNKDSTPDVVVAAGFGGSPRTAIFTGQSVLAGSPARLVGDFFAFPGSDAVNLRNGSFVAAGDVDGDGFADLVFGGGPGGAPRVFILSGALVSAGQVDAAQASPVANFFVAGDAGDRGGARVATKDADGDTRTDVVVGSGAGRPARVRVYLGKDFAGPGEPGTVQDLAPFGGAVLADGVFVG